ncbi:MAG TPA: bacillithiol biosynthesis cysteine-adding enzyme BshC [Terriglobales bacterium]|nr:bacillithiol biosynthesis cysteine-adding enzyme BshC [Terriglobales bacterium]
MTSHCFPFRQVPHSTRIFLDYLDYTPAVREFFPRSPRFLDWALEEASLVKYPPERRAQLANVLERQNRAFGGSSTTLENIAAFRAGSLAVVTGQQVGLFGGPAFAIYKALTAIKLAAEARRLGINCVPIFWLATEDHDLEEVNHTRIPSPDGNLEAVASGARGADDAPVGKVSFGSEISGLLSHVQELIGDSEIAKILADCYCPGEDFGSAFAKLFSRLFADFGVILLDGSDPELDQIASPIYRDLIGRSGELNQALLRRDQEMQSAGYHQQVRVTAATVPLFVFKNGSRIPVHADQAGKFLVGNQEVSKEELLNLASSSPQSLSPSVLLRPIVQDYLLPTLAYVGGSAEVAYFAQAGALYQQLLGRVTPIIPRFSATLVEPKPKALLERYRLSFADLFQGPEALREKIGAHLLGPNLQNSFKQAQTAVERSMAAVQDALAHLDKTLVESAQNATSKMLYQITNLQSRAARAELRHSEVADRHARVLSNSLFPDKTLQEREFAGIYFLAKHGRELLDNLLNTVNPECLDHQLVDL